MEEKKHLRLAMQKELAALSPEEISRAGEKACKIIIESEVWKRSLSIISYIPLPKGEFDVQALNRAALLGGKTLLLPRIEGKQLSLVPVPSLKDLHGKDFLKAGPFRGLREPAPTQNALSFKDIPLPALALIPGLAFTRRGERLGRGKGYYDGLLCKCSKIYKEPSSIYTMGMAFPTQILEEVPVEEHDQHLDALYMDGSIFSMEENKWHV